MLDGKYLYITFLRFAEYAYGHIRHDVYQLLIDGIYKKYEIYGRDNMLLTLPNKNNKDYDPRVRTTFIVAGFDAISPFNVSDKISDWVKVKIFDILFGTNFIGYLL